MLQYDTIVTEPFQILINFTKQAKQTFKVTNYERKDAEISYLIPLISALDIYLNCLCATNFIIALSLFSCNYISLISFNYSYLRFKLMVSQIYLEFANPNAYSPT